jgi:hypothetical protein
MIGRSEIKVTGGKLIRVQCTVDRGVVENVVITGDFFLHPEDGIQELEKELVMLRARGKGYVLVGAAPEDFAKAVVEAAAQASRSK